MGLAPTTCPLWRPKTRTGLCEDQHSTKDMLIELWLYTAISDSARRALPDIKQIRHHTNDKKWLINKRTKAWPEANTWQWPRLPPRWPCSFTLTVFQPGEGAPASLSTYTIGKKWKKCRDLRTGPIEIAEFWHADSFARIMKKSFSQDLDWITP